MRQGHELAHSDTYKCWMADLYRALTRMFSTDVEFAMGLCDKSNSVAMVSAIPVEGCLISLIV